MIDRKHIGRIVSRMTRVGERISCSGEVTGMEDGMLIVQVQACNEHGEAKASGRAEIAV